MQIAVAVDKTAKHAVSQAGDSAEVVERPLGGVSVLIVDGQGSGRAAKTISSALAGKASALITDGARDGAVVRAIHDWLYVQKRGRVSATIGMISVATDTKTLVLTRSGNCPIFVFSAERAWRFDSDCPPLGFYRFTRPQIQQLPLRAGLMAVTFSDGVLSAGVRSGKEMSVEAWLQKIHHFYKQDIAPDYVAGQIINHAIALDDGRPQDDTSVAVVSIRDRAGNGIRRMRVEFPLE
ncbi:MAG: serine/threonine-protein phosphatase [Firmicutes bacterium]|nr:serine/threonine-protein phosphatase [Bacillota bacterium]